MQYEDVEIRADEVRAVITKFERRTKSGRVFFPEDAVFAMKCQTLLKTAAAGIEGVSASDMSFTATDQTIHAKGDQPKVVSVEEGDFIALFDNTKNGLFGNLAKKPCSLGTLVTTKGFLACNLFDGKSHASGFVTWPSIAVAKHADAFESGAVLFQRENNKNVFPHGPRVSLCLWNASAKTLESCFDEMRLHFGYIARGKGDEFDYDDHVPEYGYEAEDSDNGYEVDD